MLARISEVQAVLGCKPKVLQTHTKKIKAKKITRLGTGLMDTSKEGCMEASMEGSIYIYNINGREYGRKYGRKYETEHGTEYGTEVWKKIPKKVWKQVKKSQQGVYKRVRKRVCNGARNDEYSLSTVGRPLRGS